MSQIAASARKLMVYKEYLFHCSTEDGSYITQKAFIRWEIL
jgi:hypothetical protein